MLSATVSLAPEDTPRTKGPAIGFPKKVCSRKPETDSAPPSSAAASTRGSRICRTIPAAVPPASGRKTAATASRAGTRVLPLSRPRTSRSSSAAVNSR